MQDELKFKDFDIKRLAGGVDKPLKEKFNVTVRDKTLQMRFQYAGKGTTSIPSRGNYGPLISAISLEASNTLSSLYFLRCSISSSSLSHREIKFSYQKLLTPCILFKN